MRDPVSHVLQFFTYDHLKSPQREISAQFSVLAHVVASGPRNPETTVALRHLLEAKDAAVRATLVTDDPPAMPSVAPGSLRGGG